MGRRILHEGVVWRLRAFGRREQSLLRTKLKPRECEHVCAQPITNDSLQQPGAGEGYNPMRFLIHIRMSRACALVWEPSGKVRLKSCTLPLTMCILLRQILCERSPEFALIRRLDLSRLGKQIRKADKERTKCTSH